MKVESQTRVNASVHAIFSLEVVDEFDPIEVWAYGLLLKVCKPQQVFLPPVHRGSNEKDRESYSRGIPGNIELKPTPIDLRYRSTPHPFSFIGVLHHQYILSCVRSSIKQNRRHIARRTLIGAHSVVKKLGVLVASHRRTSFVGIRQTIHRAIGKPLREFTDIGGYESQKSNLIEEAFAIVRPSDGRKLHKSELIREAQVILSTDQWMLGRADVDVCEIASLLKRSVHRKHSVTK